MIHHASLEHGSFGDMIANWRVRILQAMELSEKAPIVLAVTLGHIAYAKWASILLCC